MVGVNEAVATKLKRKVLHLFHTHCMVHIEDLVTKTVGETMNNPIASIEMSNICYRKGTSQKYFMSTMSNGCR